MSYPKADLGFCVRESVR